ncbi:MAG TPA: NAD(P)-dependent oxidoreductase [Thermoanaerobaculia bacterium]|jgi:nucleoside-diphosphate-sugar epimerase|nr:NAD(P)-dependent oxidoreductase [Thermoanaerobaculia bacterium]
MKPLCLVTGAPGWLGTRLVEVLRDGLPELPVADRERRIRCLVLPGTSPSALAELPAGVELVSGDVRDPRSLSELFRGMEGATVFHLCGVVSPRHTREFHEIHVEGTRNVLEAAAEAGVGRLIAISTNMVAGPNPHPERLFDEQSPRRPTLPYGKSKVLMEDLVNEAFAAGRLTTVILRPCRFYGPRQAAARTRLYWMIRQGRMPVLGKGDALWSMSYVDNTCQALLLAEESEVAAGKTYWVADRRPYTVREIADTVETLFEREFGIPVSHRRLRLPVAAGRIAAAADVILQRFGVMEPHLHALGHLQESGACSIAAAQRDLGYDPKVELEEGTRRAIQWCVDTGQPI